METYNLYIHNYKVIAVVASDPEDIDYIYILSLEPLDPQDLEQCIETLQITVDATLMALGRDVHKSNTKQDIIPKTNSKIPKGTN